MKAIYCLGFVAMGGILAGACGSEGETGGSQSASKPSTLTSVEEVDPGAACEAGGAVIHTGADVNGDGTLQTDEIESSVNVCAGTTGEKGDTGADGAGNDGANGTNGPPGASGADGKSVLSSVTAAGDTECPTGGSVVSFGIDDNANSLLDATEIESSTTVCNGERGEDACAPVFRITPIDPGTVCEAGGVLIAFGADSGIMGDGSQGGAAGGPTAQTCDGVLSEGEETGTRTVCNGVDGEDGIDGEDGEDGVDGQDGAPGAQSLVKLSPESQGANCSKGGTRIDTGLDDGAPTGTAKNGVLEAGEIDSTAYACNGVVYEDWLVGTACNGQATPCTATETGYHYKGAYDGYQCWWHTKNQAWNTTTATNIYSLAQHFGLNASTAVQNWCQPFSGTPTPLSYSTFASYTLPTNVGAWGWCGGTNLSSGGWVCLK